MNYSINMNSSIIRIISNFLVFLGIVCPGFVYFPMESMRGLLFSCLIIVHLLFFYKRLLNQRHSELLIILILIFGFLLIESYQILYEGNWALLRFIIMICFGLIFSYCTCQRSDYFLPALSMTCLFLFTVWLLLLCFNADLYFKPDGLPSSARAGVRFLPFPRVVLFSSPKEISILFGVMFVYFSSLCNLGTITLINVKKIIKQSYLFILILISLFMVIACQTISTYVFIAFHFMFLLQARMHGFSKIIFLFSIIIGLVILEGSVANISTRYIGSYNIIKDSLVNGVVEQISNAIMIGPGFGFFDTDDGKLRFVCVIEATGLLPRLIFEVGLIPVLAWALFIIIRYREGFKYLLYIAVASLPLSHYHTAYILGILVGSLMIIRKNKCHDVSITSSPPVAGILENQKILTLISTSFQRQINELGMRSLSSSSKDIKPS